MATEFITSFADGEYVLTSRLDSIQARTDKAKVAVAVIRDPDGEIDIFFQTTLYAFNGVVELSALGKLIEERFRARGRITDMMSVVIDGVALDFNVMYCTYNLNSDFDYRNCFWTTSQSSIVHRNSAISMAHMETGDRNYHVKVVGTDATGRTVMAERDFTRQSGTYWVSFAVNEIINFALHKTEHDPGVEMVRVGYFYIEHGDIQKIYYLADDPEYLLFRFRNLFNVPEFVDVVGKLKRKTSVDRDTAICGGKSRHYNQVINRTFEVETGALTPDQALTLEQLFCSHEVELCGSVDDYRILITDHTCEVDNDDENLVTMKFSFRMEGARPVLLDSEMAMLVPGHTHIFTHEFTADFS